MALSLIQGAACPWLSRGHCPARYGAASVSSEDVRRTILEGLDEGGLDLSGTARTFDYKEIKTESLSILIVYKKSYQIGTMLLSIQQDSSNMEIKFAFPGSIQSEWAWNLFLWFL